MGHEIDGHKNRIGSNKVSRNSVRPWTVVVAQLIELSLPTPVRIQSSARFIFNIAYCQLY